LKKSGINDIYNKAELQNYIYDMDLENTTNIHPLVTDIFEPKYFFPKLYEKITDMPSLAYRALIHGGIEMDGDEQYNTDLGGDRFYLPSSYEIVDLNK
jgi:hypothetical protein